MASLPYYGDVALDEIFAGRWRRTQTRPDSFAEQQIKLAKMALEDMIDTGARLVEGLQGDKVN